MSYTLDQSEIKALTPLQFYIMHQILFINFIVGSMYYSRSTSAGHIDEVDKTKLVYGMGDVNQIGALYNE